MRERHMITALTLAACLVAGTPTARADALDADSYDNFVKMSAGHPNEQARWRALWAYRNGHHEQALNYFQQAAYYGDKPAQHLLSMMYWRGEGTTRDPARAYIWADLAAERNNVRDLIEMREQIWASLSPAQQRRAMDDGQAYFDRYGDAVAVHRANSRIRRFAHHRTGSYAGSDTMAVSTTLGGPNMGTWGGAGSASAFTGRAAANSETMYGPERINPRLYWKQQDQELAALVSAVNGGNVNVGPLEAVRAAPVQGEK